MRHWPTLIAVTLALLITGCGSDPGYDRNVDFARKQGLVEIVNLIPDSPELAVLHGFNQYLVKFPFSSGEQAKVEDFYDWRIGYLDADDNEVELDRGESQRVTENSFTTFLLLGTVDQPRVDIVDISFVPVSDRPENEARLWFASNLSDIPMVDVYVTAFGAELGAATATLTSGMYTAPVSVTPGTDRQVRVTVAGTTDVLFDSGAISLFDKTLELFAVVDDFGPDSGMHVDVLRTLGTTGDKAIADVSQPVNVRAANYSTSTPIDISLSDLDINGIASGDLTGYQAATAGTQTIDVSNVDGLLGTQDIGLNAGSYQTLLTFDDTDSDTTPATVSVIITDQFRTRTERAVFQFVNGSGELVDLTLLRGSQELSSVAPVANDLTFNTTSTVEILTGAVRFVVTNSDRSETLGEVTFDLSEGDTVTLVLDPQNVLHSYSD